jgi:hypothetical protein
VLIIGTLKRRPGIGAGAAAYDPKHTFTLVASISVSEGAAGAFLGADLDDA